MDNIINNTINNNIKTIESQIITNMQFQLESIHQNNREYLLTIQELEEKLYKLNKQLEYKNKEIEKLQTEIKNIENKPQDNNTGIFRKMISYIY